MISKELLLEIEKLYIKLLKQFKKFSKKTYGRSIKLNEEVLELISVVLLYFGYPRKEKLNIYIKENLFGEFADVIITTLLLAKSMDIDINDAV